ncbi:hypothetical protein T310_8794, partial [Rasamsonia emersonii CBS 393.64]
FGTLEAVAAVIGRCRPARLNTDGLPPTELYCTDIDTHDRLRRVSAQIAQSNNDSPSRNPSTASSAIALMVPGRQDHGLLRAEVDNYPPKTYLCRRSSVLYTQSTVIQGHHFDGPRRHGVIIIKR